MTRKHYEQLAAKLGANLALLKATRIQAELLAADIGVTLAALNPRFDLERFHTAVVTWWERTATPAQREAA